MKIVKINDLPNPEKESCKTCVFSQKRQASLRKCRRYPPEYPEVYDWSWCGEFVEDPNKT